MTPTELILARSRAFVRADFGFIFDSFHSGSNFRRQFTGRDEYLRVGQTSLAHDYRILDCRVLDERIAGPEAEVLFLVEMEVQGQAQHYAERAWLRIEAGGWKYHRGQKITAEELPASPESLTFADFEKLDPSTVF